MSPFREKMCIFVSSFFNNNFFKNIDFQNVRRKDIKG